MFFESPLVSLTSSVVRLGLTAPVRLLVRIVARLICCRKLKSWMVFECVVVLKWLSGHESCYLDSKH